MYACKMICGADSENDCRLLRIRSSVYSFLMRTWSFMKESAICLVGKRNLVTYSRHALLAAALAHLYRIDTGKVTAKRIHFQNFLIPNVSSPLMRFNWLIQ